MREPVLVNRSNLYYNNWRYVILLLLPDASFLRVLKHEAIDQSINYRNSWIASRTSRPVSTDSREVLHQVCDYLLSRQQPYKKVVCGNGLWIYTNNLEDFENFDSFPTSDILYVNEANLTLTADAVTLKHPQHAFRTYFRERFLSEDELINLRRYFDARKGMFRLGPGFKLLVTGRRMWMMSNYFVDHDEPNADFLINMAVPGIVRKTLPIVARAK
jgi:hypothetical protein